MYKRYTLLNHLLDKFEFESVVNTLRVFCLNDKPIQNKPVIYFCNREFRIKDNFALQYALNCVHKLNSSILVLLPELTFEHKRKNEFIKRNIEEFSRHLQLANISFEFICYESLFDRLQSLDAGLLVKDFNPISDFSFFSTLNYCVCEVDSHNIIPARYISRKQEYSAATFRPKVYNSISTFLTYFSNEFNFSNEADIALDIFINEKLDNYALFRNDPTKDALSGLSKYLNLGFLTAQRVALSILEANVDVVNKEVFLEELIVRKELAENFCLYCQTFRSLDCIPNWAKDTINSHQADFRLYHYSLYELENSLTHDELWNACQRQLVKDGIIHSYLRMYWAKKIMEWSFSAQDAFSNAVYLNDKYAYDAPSSNGYVGILWSIAGLHDRAFQDFFVTGKVRRMTYNSLKKKFDILSYIRNYS